MAGIFQVISLAGLVITIVLTIVMLLTFRKPRPIGAWSKLLSILLSLTILAAFILLSGARLNPLLSLPILVLGLIVGLLRGAFVQLSIRDGKVVARGSWLFLLGWGVSLALAQLLNTLGSSGWSSVGLMPVFLSTGTTIGLDATLLLRRVFTPRTPRV